MQYEKHHSNVEYLMAREQIKDDLLHRTIERWDIYHGKNVYSVLDEQRN